MKNKLAERIKELRVEKGYNQNKLATLCKVKQSCVSKWERGETLPDAEMIITLAETFNVTTDFLLGIKDY